MSHHVRKHSRGRNAADRSYERDSLTPEDAEAFATFLVEAEPVIAAKKTQLEAVGDRLYKSWAHSKQDKEDGLFKFIVAREFSPPEALKMLQSLLTFRIDNKVSQIDLKLAEHHLDYRNPFMDLRIEAISGCPIAYGRLNVMHHGMDVEAFKQSLFATFEKIFLVEKYTRKQVVGIIDFEEWGVGKNFIASAMTKLVNTAQDLFPESLYRVYLINYPGTVKAAYNIIAPLLSTRTTSKIVWLKTKEEYLPKIRAEVADPNKLPTWLGGKAEIKQPLPPPPAAAHPASHSPVTGWMHRS
mmetsp:Transcript_3936/g.10270  ORF Transcript_3936/g.10270 Transcript_3936/m.10270 type:complete len:298 (-) Transcript_3936:398-1291(-)|eukprot:CAMPEP_0174903472 /NCGR_PEP_ID=MMETSP0167-20121228/43945_1 /TAXON_ID=38298 /ORGANISM="Rhodella maculata, Strain CCMP736" /LENGTH=297 /DNA_ID=CAMNT_0016145807 /DNA_START=51 /DNA_END=944 /DNA_ORIENTATION=+